MESSDAARARLTERRIELVAELEQIDRELAQLAVKVVVSAWWKKPSGEKGRGSLFHTGVVQRCRPSNMPQEITLYEALREKLAPCGVCKPSTTSVSPR